MSTMAGIQGYVEVTNQRYVTFLLLGSYITRSKRLVRMLFEALGSFLVAWDRVLWLQERRSGEKLWRERCSACASVDALCASVDASARTALFDLRASVDAMWRRRSMQLGFPRDVEHIMRQSMQSPGGVGRCKSCVGRCKVWFVCGLLFDGKDKV